MKIHIFNPEHDMAMAANTDNFTAPHAAKQLRHDLGFLPALWCGDGDTVLVADKNQAYRAMSRLASSLERIGVKTAQNIYFIEKSNLKSLYVDAADVWGWDAALRHELICAGINAGALPSPEQTEHIRQLSHRRTSACLLRHFRGFEVTECHDYAEVETALKRYGHAIIKTPWSSSGRGLRYINASGPTSHQMGWTKNAIKKQGAVMVEPYYNKIMDFAMEFNVMQGGVAVYEGLSVFYTENGQYRGNILATEEFKEAMITRYVTKEYLHDTQQKLMAALPSVLDDFTGQLGVDMMLIKQGGGSVDIHPCVEINLRRTIGHAALAVSPSDSGYVKAMRIEYDGVKYRLKIVNAGNGAYAQSLDM